MPTRRSTCPPRRSLVAATLALLALVALIVACATPTADPLPATVAITSHTDGERVFGSRTITLTGSASNAPEVQVLVGGSVVATVDVVGDVFQADVTLGTHATVVRVQTSDGLVGDDVELMYPWVNATTFRPMDVVIGQADTTSSENGVGASLLSYATYGTPVFVGGILYVPDPYNHRILGYFGLPTEDGAPADFVLGQASFTANAPNDDAQDGVWPGTRTARTMNCPSGVASDGARLVVADACNGRILIYDALPTTSFAPADVVVGQATMTENEYTHCSMDAPFSYTDRVAVGGGRLVAVEPDGHRVLVWNSIPTENGVEPDLVLGQPSTNATCVANDDDQDGVSGDPSARTFNYPWDVWTDGDRLLVADSDNHRVLLWETFPTADFAPADVVIGQVSMTERVKGGGASGIGEAFTIASNGNQVLVPDYENARVLVFNAFPTANGAAADAVLGQSNFTNTAFNDDDQDGAMDATPSARTFGRSYGAWMGEGVMVINDNDNHRYALFVD